MKTNCWEFKNCGRDLNGTRADELDICPVSAEIRLDGVHGGKNAGRACWVGILEKGESADLNSIISQRQ